MSGILSRWIAPLWAGWTLGILTSMLTVTSRVNWDALTGVVVSLCFGYVFGSSVRRHEAVDSADTMEDVSQAIASYAHEVDDFQQAQMRRLALRSYVLALEMGAEPEGLPKAAKSSLRAELVRLGILAIDKQGRDVLLLSKPERRRRLT